jgi:hypothetical protein
MTDNTYQGWTNWDTWNANLWAANDEGVYRDILRARNPAQLEDTWRAFFYEGTEHEADGVKFIDGIDPDNVNWAQIYAALHDDDLSEEGDEDDV